jgi:hypothetical protein
MAHKRSLHPTFPDGTTWGANVVYIRYGVRDWLTASIEGYLANAKSDRFPDRDYRDLRFGLGLSSNVWSQNGFNLVPVAHYSEWFAFDRSMSRHHKQVQSILLAVEMQYGINLWPIEATFSVAPVFLHDDISQYTRYESHTDRSSQDVGGAIGIDGIVYEHVRLYAQAIFVNFWQSRTGIGWVF